MPVDRKIWKVWFRQEDFKAIPCPLCEGGNLLANTKNIYEKQTEESRAYISKDYGQDPLDYVGSFYATLSCSKCKENVHVIGKSAYDEFYINTSDGGIDRGYILTYSPASFYPAPHLLKLGDYIPIAIADELKTAFALFWQDYSASGNRIRVAVERILDELKVPRFNTKKRPILLHPRIEKFNTQYPKYSYLTEHLTAIKWLGNDSSHTAGLTINDIFVALDILEFVLEELFHDRRKTLQKLAAKINKKKGSIYKKKK